jgi:homoserine O-acetyltransferase
MGGEQTFVWAVMHPEFFDLAVPILGTPRETSYDLLVKQIQVDAIIIRAGAPQPMDANDRLWQLAAIMQQDVIGSRTIEEAARAALPHFLVIVSAEDHLVNPQPALEWAAAIGAPTYISHGACAHLIMTCDAAAVSSRVKSFLAAGKLQ